MQKKHIYAVQAFALCLLETIDEAGPLGAPSGVMYAAVAGEVNLSQYEQVLGQMQGKGFISKDGDCWSMTQSGKDFLVKLKSAVARAREEMLAECHKEGVPA